MSLRNRAFVPSELGSDFEQRNWCQGVLRRSPSIVTAFVIASTISGDGNWQSQARLLFSAPTPSHHMDYTKKIFGKTPSPWSGCPSISTCPNRVLSKQIHFRDTCTFLTRQEDNFPRLSRPLQGHTAHTPSLTGMSPSRRHDAQSQSILVRLSIEVAINFLVWRPFRVRVKSATSADACIICSCDWLCWKVKTLDNC